MFAGLVHTWTKNFDKFGLMDQNFRENIVILVRLDQNYPDQNSSDMPSPLLQDVMSVQRFGSGNGGVHYAITNVQPSLHADCQ